MTVTPTADIEQLHREALAALRRRDYRRTHACCIAILEAEPRFADAWFLLGMIAADHGNVGKGAELVERAIFLGARAEYHAQLGRCFVALQRPRDALDEARRALAIGPENALSFDTVGVVLSRVGAHDEAIAPFREAVRLDAGKPAYWYNLGASLQFIGGFKEAADAYRRAIMLDPGHFRARSSLAQVEAPDEVAAEEIRARLDAGPQEVDAELHLCHALARHYEERGQWPEALRLLARGKRRKRADLGYRFESDQALFDAATETLDAWQDAPGHDSPEPIFIVGMPRTGTTLVERIVSSHPEVFPAGELTHFALALKRAVGSASNLVLDPETLRGAAASDPATVGRAYVESTRPRTGHTPRFIDKMPLNFFYAALIRRALPRARIICLRRNALDTCLSNYRQLFATGFSYYNYAYALEDTARYFVGFDRLVQSFAQALGEGFMEVHYERVVENLEREARRLLVFCGLDWHPAVLDFHANQAPVATASSVQVRQPVYASSVGRWRRLEEELAPARRILEQAGISLGE